MNKGRIGIGLIGVGRHGLRYAQHIVRDLPTAYLSAVCRRHPEQGFDVPGEPPVNVYGKAASLIADSTVDVVIVVTPPICYPEICRLAVQARKPMLIEKPLGITAADAHAIADSVRKAGVPLMTAQTLRFDNTVQHMKKLQHDIGRSDRLDLVSRIETRKTALDHADGYGRRGALLEIGVHMLDLVRFITGEEVCEARCTMDVRPDAGPETAASVRLTTSSGTRCQIEIARVPADRVGRATWWGSQGRLDVDWVQRQVRLSDGTDTENFELPPSQTVLATLTAFLQAVTVNSPMPVTGEDGYRAVEIAEACYKSAQAGGAPVLLNRRS
jgi:predicted dehydrogenase